MAYGYNVTTHTPEGYIRTGRPTRATYDTQQDDTRRLWLVLHGYTAATSFQRRAAYEMLKARGVNV